MNKILLLGGTNFIGRNLVEHLSVLENCEVTLFNRQQSNTDLFPDLNKIKGDRETDDITQISNTNWDYVIDLSCYYPAALQSVLDSINPVKKYVFVSTCSVYDNEKNQTICRNEDAPILTCSPTQATDRTNATYGNRKAECERLLRDSKQLHAILRPALVFGKYDPTDRLYFWLHQVARKDEWMLPENGSRMFSVTYVQDLVTAIVQCIEQKEVTGIFNVVTKPQTSIKEIVDIAKKSLNRNQPVFNASASFLYENKVQPWIDMPLWLHADYFTYDNEKLKNTLRFKPTLMKDALHETITYFQDRNWPKPSYGMSEETQQTLLQKVKQLQQ